MTIEDLLELGFKRIDVTEEELIEIGDEDSLPWFYFQYEILPLGDDVTKDTENYFVLETPASDELTREEVNGDGWYVEMFDFEEFKFHNKSDVQMLQMLLKDNAKRN